MNLPPLAARLAGLKPTAVNQVLQELKPLQEQKRPLYSLMRGQPDFATPEHIVRAAVESLRRGRTSYPDNRGEPVLRQAIAEKLRRDNQLAYDWQREILVTDGATGGLSAALAVLVQAGDEVLLPDPIYDAYAAPIALWGGKPTPISSTVRAGRFTFERAALEQAWTTRARVILLNTPWNPTGTVLTRDELAMVADFARAKNLWILSDEIYEAMIFDGKSHLSPAQLSPDSWQRTLVVNSLSKTYAMTGWRCGYCAGPAELINGLLLVWQQSSRGPATFVQDAAAAALLGEQSCVRDMAEELEQRRDRVLEKLAGLPGVSAPRPEGGLFVMVDVRGLRRSADEVRRFLLQEVGVVVLPGSAYGPGGEGSLRVSFAAGGESLMQGLEQLRRGLATLAAAGCQTVCSNDVAGQHGHDSCEPRDS